MCCGRRTTACTKSTAPAQLLSRHAGAVWRLARLSAPLVASMYDSGARPDKPSPVHWRYHKGTRMDQRTADAYVYPALFLTTTLYAVVLDTNQRYAPPDQKIEPDGIWKEVVIGDTLCLIAATIRAYLGPNERWSVVRATGLAFIVGGTPMIVWQLWRARERAAQARDIWQHILEQAHATGSTATPTGIANPRWPSPPAHRRNGTRLR